MQIELDFHSFYNVCQQSKRQKWKASINLLQNQSVTSPLNNPTTQVPVSVVDWPDNEIAEKWIWFKFGFVLRKFLFPNHIPRFVKT